MKRLLQLLDPKEHSLKTKMTVAFLAISILSVILTASISNYYYNRAIVIDFQNVSLEATKRLSYQVQFYIKQITRSTGPLIGSDLIQEWIHHTNPNSQDLELQIEGELRRFIGFNCRECIAMFLESTDQRLISMSNIPFKINYDNSEHWYGHPIEKQSVMLPVIEKHLYGGRDTPVLSLLVPIFSNRNGELKGRLVIDLGLKEMDQIFSQSNLGQRGVFFILSEKQMVVYHLNHEWIGKHLSNTGLQEIDLSYQNTASIQVIDGVKMLIGRGIVTQNGWYIVTAVPFDEMASGLRVANITIIVFLCAIVLLIVSVVPVYVNNMLRPIHTLVRHLEVVERGNLEVRAAVEGRDEIQILNVRFNQMLESLTTLIQTVAALELKEVRLQLHQKEAQIKALQHQVNPHFLYNTLDIVKSMAYLGKNEMVVSMTHNLADFYRYNVKHSDTKVTLKDELTHLKTYLDIIHIRFPDNFKSESVINERYLNCEIIKFSLQPIVENAVKYAIESSFGDGIIRINAFESDGDLFIEIADNGEGIEAELLSEIQEDLKYITKNVNKEFIKRHQVGISNVHARMILEYGPNYGVNIVSFIGRGTIVTLKIPFKLVT